MEKDIKLEDIAKIETLTNQRDVNIYLSTGWLLIDYRIEKLA